MRVIKKILIIGTVFLSVITFQAFASEVILKGISIKPAGQPYSNLDRTWFVYELEPGSKIEDAFYVINNTTEEKEIDVYPSDSTPSSDGGFALKQKVEEMTDIGSWVTLEKYEVKLAPKEAEMIKFTLQVPDDKTLDIGEHSGAILIQEKPKPLDPNQSGIILTTRVGARVYVTLPGEIKKSIEYASFDSKPTKYKSYNIPYIGNFISKLLKIPQTYTFSTGFRNSGNVSNDVNIVVTVNDEIFNINNEEINGSQKVGRDTDAMMNLEWKVPLFGKYTIKGVGTYKVLDGEKTFETSAITLWIIPWDLVAAEGMLLLALIIIFTARKLKYRKGKMKKYKVTKKDTLQSLSIRRKIKWEKIAEINRLKPPYELKAGAVILLPPVKSIGKRPHVKKKKNML